MPVAVLGLAAFVLGVIVGGRSASEEAAQRFTEAWAPSGLRGDARGADREHGGQVSINRFTTLYDEAGRTATIESVEPHDPDGTETVSAGGGHGAGRRAHPRVRGTWAGRWRSRLPMARSRGRPHLVFPGYPTVRAFPVAPMSPSGRRSSPRTARRWPRDRPRPAARRSAARRSTWPAAWSPEGAGKQSSMARFPGGTLAGKSGARGVQHAARRPAGASCSPRATRGEA